MNAAALKRRRVLQALATAPLALGGARLWAADYPAAPVKIIAPFPPGGSLDTVARAMRTELSARLGQQFVVENRAGANGQIGTASVARAAPDGYTILITTDGAFSIPSLTSVLPYEPLRDFVPLSMVAELSFLLVANPQFGPSTLQDTIAFMKANPGRVAYASPGPGSQHHIAMELFAKKAGVELLNVPYPGAAQMLTGLLGDQVSIMIAGVQNALELVRGGKLKTIAYAGPARHPLLPNVPTFTEAGLPGYESRAWFGAFAPTGTPPDVVAKLSSTLWDIVNRKEFSDSFFLPQGFDARPSVPPARFPAYLREDRRKYETTLQAMNLQPVLAK